MSSPSTVVASPQQPCAAVAAQPAEKKSKRSSHTKASSSSSRLKALQQQQQQQQRFDALLSDLQADEGEDADDDAALTANESAASRHAFVRDNQLASLRAELEATRQHLAVQQREAAKLQSDFRKQAARADAAGAKSDALVETMKQALGFRELLAQRDDARDAAAKLRIEGERLRTLLSMPRSSAEATSVADIATAAPISNPANPATKDRELNGNNSNVDERDQREMLIAMGLRREFESTRSEFQQQLSLKDGEMERLQHDLAELKRKREADGSRLWEQSQEIAALKQQLEDARSKLVEEQQAHEKSQLREAKYRARAIAAAAAAATAPPQQQPSSSPPPSPPALPPPTPDQEARIRQLQDDNEMAQEELAALRAELSYLRNHEQRQQQQQRRVTSGKASGSSSGAQSQPRSASSSVARGHDV
jgi:hypothetical protein